MTVMILSKNDALVQQHVGEIKTCTHMHTYKQAGLPKQLLPVPKHGLY
jgi:hypothetical protein